MAKFNKASMFLAIVLSLLLMISTAQARKVSTGFGGAKPTAQCVAVTGAEDGDTCTSVAQLFGMTLKFFISINPNINCDDIFVGQWLCISGSP
ncbi:lysM domain-containing protein ARB_03438-like [Mercurialis annua]|uniref:lysM domain-containing protein ARB_03438-like n=1 Tax=Mercurialis annua TaxID=3986 RepID=UPI00215F938A|nr:lysM domain-containing protein ARB_03438-like [Mercurialis annua]